MIGYIVKKFIGSKNDRRSSASSPGRANQRLEAELQKVSDDALRQKTAAWKEEISKIQTMRHLPVGCAKSCPRHSGREKRLPASLRHRDHRPRASIGLGDDSLRRAAHRRYACMPAKLRNGHRRRQNARRTLPVYLNALSGRGVHIVTVNDYLAARDGEWMARCISSSV